MAYGFGNTVNPQLGATNYSGFLQGALSGAQMQAQGGAAIGQGLAQGIASGVEGIQKYKEKKEKKAQEDAAITSLQNIAKTNPTIAKSLGFDPNDTGAAKAFITGVGGPAAAINIANSLGQMQQAEQKRNRDEQAARVAGLYSQGRGTLPSMVNPGSIDPVALQQGRNAYLQTTLTESEIARRQAEAKKLATPSPQDQTAAQQNTNAIIGAELEAGILDPKDVPARRAALLAAGGSNPRIERAGTYVDSANPSKSVTGVFHNGMIGTFDDKGKFTPLPASFKPSTLSDANAFLDPAAMAKLSDEVVLEGKSIQTLNKYLKGTEGLNTGINKGIDRLTKSINTILNKDLSKSEEALGVEAARQQRLLGALRTTILGPGVLTEIDAQRILEAIGGDIQSIFTNPEIVSQVVSDILDEKEDSYNQKLNIYNQHVVGRYSGTGYSQRKKIDRADRSGSGIDLGGGFNLIP
jgi:hypothetical protein